VRSCEPKQRLPLILCARKLSIIAWYWLVAGKKSSAIYINNESTEVLRVDADVWTEFELTLLTLTLPAPSGLLIYVGFLYDLK